MEIKRRAAGYRHGSMEDWRRAAGVAIRRYSGMEAWSSGDAL